MVNRPFDPDDPSGFSGAKLALFLGADLLTLLRDDRPDIPFPGFWDLPGGGREGAESPAACALRETREEVGLVVPHTAITYGESYLRPHGRVWFFAAHLPAQAAGDIRFGDEGQGWRMVRPERFTRDLKAVPYLQAQVQRYVSAPEFTRNMV
jgi:8-oxo-dGTP diphosphatase